MEKYIIDILKPAKKDLIKLYKSGDTASIKRVNQILKELEENPREGIGNPEQLKYQDSEIWSRKINKKDRLVYQIIDDEILILVLKAIGHYGDK